MSTRRNDDLLRELIARSDIVIRLLEQLIVEVSKGKKTKNDQFQRDQLGRGAGRR